MSPALAGGFFTAEPTMKSFTSDIDESEVDLKNEYSENCPFCRGNENSSPNSKFEIEDENGWVVRSVDNKYPIVDNFQDEIYGSHEVIIDTHRHNGSFYNMSENEFYNMILMYKHRYTEFIKDEKIQYVTIFKNYLRKAGASLNHPHSQIVSISKIPLSFSLVHKINCLFPWSFLFNSHTA